MPQKDLENKFVDINAIGVNVSNNDWEDCHRIGKSRNNSNKQTNKQTNKQKTIARFTDREVVKDVLYNRKKLKTINKEVLEMEKVMLFLNEKLSEKNNKIAFLCRKLKREGMIPNTYSINRIIRLSCNKISNGRVQKVPCISYLFEHFPDFGLEDNENADESGFTNESLQCSY